MKRLTKITTALVVTFGLMLGGATAALAAGTYTGWSHKSKSGICTLFRICNYTTHCYPSNPYTAAVKPKRIDGRICYGAHVDAH